MATQNYRDRSDETVKLNELTAKIAPGHAPEQQPKPGAENRTPSPVRPVTTTADQARSTSWGRSGGGPGDNPGKQGYGGASSLNPGERSAPATINPNAPNDAVLQGLIEGRTARLDAQDPWQTRPVTDEQAVPTTFGHRDRTADSNAAKVPAKLGDNGGAPVRQP